MSLTKPHGFTAKNIKSIIKNCIPIKEQFYSNNNSRCFDTKKKCVVAYEIDSTYQSSLCGTAFDYLARFCIAHVAKHNRDIVLNNLVAEQFISDTFRLRTIKSSKKTKEKLEKENIHLSLPDEVVCGNITYSYLSEICDVEKEKIQELISHDLIKIRFLTNREEKETLVKLKNGYRELLKPVENYINGEFLDESILIDICIVLAKIEHMKRSGVGAIPISKIFDYDMNNKCVKEELRKMLCSFKGVFLPLINKDSIVVYNPHFGIGSRIIGGADADIYIDGVLYDFKTTIKNGWNSADVSQIVGYYLLDTIAKKCEDVNDDLKEYPIYKVALYKVRHEEVAYFDVKNISVDLLEKAIEEICYVYIMYNMSSLIPLGKDKEIIEKYGIPLTKRELLNFCTDSAKEDLEWGLKHDDKVSNFWKKRMKEISKAQSVMKEYLDSEDVMKLFRGLVQEHNHDTMNLNK